MRQIVFVFELAEGSLFVLKKFRKRVLLERTLRGLLYGLAAGLIATAILVMSFMLADLTAWYFYLIAGLVGLMAWVVVMVGYLLFRKVKDKEVAKRIDDTYKLKEKASTMLAYEGQESLLIDKQREDAKAHVQKQNPKRITVKLAAFNIPLLVLGVACLTTSSFTSEIKASFESQETDDVVDYDDDTDKIINEIEDYVGKSQASQAFKEKLYAILEQLRTDLKGDIDISSRQRKVDAAKALVDEALDEVNTKEEIGEELAKVESDLKAVGEALKAGDVKATDAAFETLIADIQGLVSTDSIIDLLKDWATEIDKALKDSGVASSDANYVTFADLSAKLKAVYKNVEEKAASSQYVSSSMLTQLIRDSREQVVKALEEALARLDKDIPIENANTQLAEDVKKLMDQLVDPTKDQGGEDGDSQGESGNGDGEEEGDVGDSGDQETDANDGEEGGAQGGQGDGSGDKGEGSGSGSGGQEGEGNGNGQGEGAAGGGGETEYGSNDKIYTGEYGETEYGEVLGEYQGQASDDARNTGDDDLEGAIGDYLDELYGDKLSGNNSSNNG